MQVEWKNRFLQVHGNKYDYSKVVYVNQTTEVIVGCDKHKEVEWLTKENGIFWFKITPKHHWNGSGCKMCSGNYSPTLEEAIKRANLVNNFEYDYSDVVEYTNQDAKVKINHKDHYFYQSFKLQWRGEGCPVCSGKKTFEEIQKEVVVPKKEKKKQTTKINFIEKAKLVWNDRFDYSKTTYINNKTKVTITCKEHGDFTQFPNSHLDGRVGCKECRVKNLQIDFQYNGNYREEYIKLIRNARKNIPNDNYEVHHILPKSMFPLWKNKSSNLVKLTIEDHYKAHYLLYKIYNNKKMALAFSLMLKVTGNKFNPQLYKEIISKARQIGNPVYCYELDKSFPSAKEAERQLSIKQGIAPLCKSKNFNYTVGNKHFCYLADKEEAANYWNANKLQYNDRRFNKVYCLETNTEYNSATEAAKNNSLKSLKSVTRCCKNWKQTANNKHFCFLEDKEEAINYWQNNLDKKCKQ